MCGTGLDYQKTPGKNDAAAKARFSRFVAAGSPIQAVGMVPAAAFRPRPPRYLPSRRAVGNMKW